MHRRDLLPCLAVAVALAFAPGTSGQAPPQSCGRLDAAAVGDPDLYCIDLLPGMRHRRGRRHSVASRRPPRISASRYGDPCRRAAARRDLQPPRSAAALIAGQLHGVYRVGHHAADGARVAARSSRQWRDQARTATIRQVADPDHGRSVGIRRVEDRAARVARHIGQRAHAAARSRLPACGPDRYGRRACAPRFAGAWRARTPQPWRRRVDAAADVPRSGDAAGDDDAAPGCRVVSSRRRRGADREAAAAGARLPTATRSRSPPRRCAATSPDERSRCTASTASIRVR